MENEPVAWRSKDTDGYWSIYQAPVEGAEPLYTHPAKTLPDGIDLLEKYANKLEDERPNKGLSDVVYECVAILRKAQEK